MKLEIERPFVEALVQQFERLAPLKEQLKFASRAEIEFRRLTGAEADFLRGLYDRAGAAFQARSARLDTLQEAFKDGGERFAPEDLERLLPALIRYLMKDAVRGWLFAMAVTDKPLPFVVTRLDFTPHSNDETAKIFMELKANARGQISAITLRITANDLAGKTVAEILAAKGFLKETLFYFVHICIYLYTGEYKFK